MCIVITGKAVASAPIFCYKLVRRLRVFSQIGGESEFMSRYEPGARRPMKGGDLTRGRDLEYKVGAVRGGWPIVYASPPYSLSSFEYPILVCRIDPGTRYMTGYDESKFSSRRYPTLVPERMFVVRVFDC